jgi:hypothetical protein
LSEILRQKAREQGHSIKEMVNDLLRASIAAGKEVSPRRKAVNVMAKPPGLKAGYDPDKLNQLVDELETNELARKL